MGQFQITNVKPRLIHIGGVSLPPNATSGEGKIPHIDPKHETAVRKSAAFRSGSVVEGNAKVPVPPLDISKINWPAVKKIIDTESDFKNLSAWAESEKRTEVLAAIKARISSL